MNRKELLEIRRRLKAEDANITQFFGCYVNSLRQIISSFSVSLATMNETESGMYFDLLKKAISGNGSKNLVTVKLERDSVQQRMLNDFRLYGVSDENRREQFFRQIIENADMDGNYLILLALDRYDVPVRSASGELDRDSSAGMFTYFICALCPVIDAEAKLAYLSDEREFHSNTVGQTVGAPAAGFMYPSFADRSTNLDKLLYYMKNPAEPHEELVSGLFGAKRPMVDTEKRELFRQSLAEVTDGSCEFTAVQNLYQAMRERDELIRTSEMPEMEMLRSDDIRDILTEGGMAHETARKIASSYAENVGSDARLMPGAVMDPGKFQMATPEVKVTVNPDLAALVKMRTIDGKRYILIPADGGVELNGLSVF